MNPLEALIEQLSQSAGKRGSTFAGRVIPKGATPNVVELLAQLPQDVPDMDWGTALPAMLAGLKVYHGGPKSFTKFDPKMFGKTTDPGFAGRGAYVTTSEDVARRWGPHVMETEIPDSFKAAEISGISDMYKQHGMVPLTEAQKKLSQKEMMKIFEQRSQEVTDKLIAQGYEGVKWPHELEKQIQYVLFHPELFNFVVKK